MQSNKYRGGSPDGTDFQIAKEVKRYREGDASALLRVVALGVEFHRPIPRDMADAFDAGVTRWDNLEVKTLSDAFNIEDRTGKGFAVRRRHRRLAMPAWAMVRELVSGPSDYHPTGMSKTEACEQVAEELGIGRAAVRALFDETEAALRLAGLDEVLDLGAIAGEIKQESHQNADDRDEKPRPSVLKARRALLASLDEEIQDED
jgi:hypothetical protein